MNRFFLAVAALGFALYCIVMVRDGLRTGGLRALGRGLPFFQRSREPSWFWFAVTLDSFLALGALFIGTVAAIRWVETL